jgi:hypothetical protein
LAALRLRSKPPLVKLATVAKDALSRLNKLVAKGYVVRWGQSDEDTLRLEHPSAPILTLYPDGSLWVVVLTDEPRFQSFAEPDDWLTPDDVLRFDSLVDSVPKPTELQSFKAMTVEDVWGKVQFGAWCVLFGLGVGLGIWFLFRGIVFLINWLHRVAAG